MTDEELDALVEYLRDKGFISQREADAITALRAQLAEALETWPIWAVQIKDKLQSYGVDPGDEWNVAEQFEAWLDEAVSDETARAEAAEAALKDAIEQLKRVHDDAFRQAGGYALAIPAANVTLAQALAVPEVRALVNAATALQADMMERAECRMDRISGEQYRIVNAGNGVWNRFRAAIAALKGGDA